MKSYFTDESPTSPVLARATAQPAGELRKPLITRFGDVIDVRNRGTLKVMRITGSQAVTQDAPAVVRLWTNQQFRELTAHQARALAAQLLEAASFTELQNNH